MPDTCQQTGKLSYPSFNAANTTLRRMRKSGRGAPNAYRCKFCAQWHLGRNGEYRRAMMRST